MMKALRELGYQVYEAQANYICFEGPQDLYEFCADQGILIRDCSNYRNLQPGCYRIAVKLRKENEQLLEVLGRHGR